MSDNSMGTIRATITIQPFATLTPHTEEELMTTYHERLEAGEYAGDGPEHETSKAQPLKADKAEAEADDNEENDDEDIAATAAAEARAAELGVDLDTVEGSGYRGRVTVGDVEAAYEASAG